MIGFRSIEHQGHAAAKLVAARGDKEAADQHNPYPYQSLAFYEYQNGCGAFRRGDVINRSGQIVNPTTPATKAPKYIDKGSAW